MEIVDLLKIGSKKPGILETQGKKGCVSLPPKVDKKPPNSKLFHFSTYLIPVKSALQLIDQHCVNENKVSMRHKGCPNSSEISPSRLWTIFLLLHSFKWQWTHSRGYQGWDKCRQRNNLLGLHFLALFPLSGIHMYVDICWNFKHTAIYGIYFGCQRVKTPYFFLILM